MESEKNKTLELEPQNTEGTYIGENRRYTCSNHLKLLHVASQK